MTNYPGPQDPQGTDPQAPQGQQYPQYPQYPQGQNPPYGSAPGMGQPPAPPPSILNAVKLMYAGSR
jgi:hypothetical protein